MTAILSAASRELQFKQIDQLKSFGEKSVDPDFLDLQPIVNYTYLKPGPDYFSIAKRLSLI
jgi:hypothetical protein